MEVLGHLQEYLRHMQQMGLNGLCMDENPFLTAFQAPAPPPARSHAPIQRGAAPPPRPVLVKNQPAPKPEKSGTPDLLSIMKTVDLMGTSEDNRARAAKVEGDDAVTLLKNLYNTFHNCQACPLGTTCNRFVFGEGPPESQIMFVGEYPAREDDTIGRPFMDASGQLLTKIISAMGLKRHEVFVTNVVKCHPPGGRVPLPDELDTCAPILERQIEAVNPRVIVALGPTALRFFRGEGVSLMRVRGQLFPWQDRQVMGTFHPAYIMRNPRSKREVWADLQRVMAYLKQT